MHFPDTLSPRREQYHRVMADVHEQDLKLKEEVIHLGRQLENQQSFIDSIEKKFVYDHQCVHSCVAISRFSFPHPFTLR
jgi:hypothetical protein